jgi:hypothetical protein
MYDVKRKKWIEKLKLQNYNNNAMYVEELSHFLRSVKTKQKTINSIEDGSRVLEIALAIKKSSKIKKVITID